MTNRLDLSEDDRAGLLHTTSQRWANAQFGQLEEEPVDGNIIDALRWCLVVTVFIALAAFTVWSAL